jgi:hypothetical protein
MTYMPERIWARQTATDWRGAMGTWDVCSSDASAGAEYVHGDIAAEDRATARVEALRAAARIAGAHDYSIQSSTAADDRARQVQAAILALIAQEERV